MLLNVLVLGQNGQLAKELERRRWPEGWAVEFASRAAIDLAEPGAAAAAVLDRKPGLVINAAAYTAVDRAETEPELAWNINAVAPGAIASACATLAVPLVTVSTDYVFDGSNPAPYTEADPVCPLNQYGRSKAEGEQRVRQAHDWHLILRTSWVFSAFGSNFVLTMLRLGAERPSLRVVADQKGRPTAAADLAEAILAASVRLAEDRTCSGTFHVTNAGATTWHGFASAIFELAKARGARVPERIEPIGTADYPTPARRPLNSELDCARFERVFRHALRSWRAGLSEVLDERLAPPVGEQRI